MSIGGSLAIGQVPVWYGVEPLDAATDTNPPVAEVIDAIHPKRNRPILVKCGLTTGQFLGESISWYLGNVLGARLPDAGAVQWHTVPSWGMEMVGSRNWLDGDKSAVIDPRELAAMIALDVLVWNHDRSSDNIVVHDTGSFGVVAYAIDHAEAKLIEPESIEPALVGQPLEINAAAYPESQAPPPSLPWDLLLDQMHVAVGRLRGSMQRNLAALDNYVRHACLLAKAPQRHPAIAAALYTRCGLLDELVRSHALTIPQFFQALAALDHQVAPITQEEEAWPLPSA